MVVRQNSRSTSPSPSRWVIRTAAARLKRFLEFENHSIFGQVEVVDSFNTVPVKVGTEIAVQPWLVSSVESIDDEKNDHSPSKLEVPSLKQRSSQLLMTSKSQIFGRRVLLVDGN